jgi:hypothetical protein
MDVGEDSKAEEREMGGMEAMGGDVYKNAPWVTCTPGAAFQITSRLGQLANQPADQTRQRARTTSRPRAVTGWPGPTPWLVRYGRRLPAITGSSAGSAARCAA